MIRVETLQQSALIANLGLNEFRSDGDLKVRVVLTTILKATGQTARLHGWFEAAQIASSSRNQGDGNATFEKFDHGLGRDSDTVAEQDSFDFGQRHRGRGSLFIWNRNNQALRIE